MSTQKISATSVHAADVLVQNFTFHPAKDVEATRDNLAVLIEYTTKSNEVAKNLAYMLGRIPWYDAHALEANLDEFRDCVRRLEMVNESLPRYQEEVETEAVNLRDPCIQRRYGISPQAQAAADIVFKFFRVERKSRLAPTNGNVALIVDVCTSAFRVEAALQFVCRVLPWQDKFELHRQLRTTRMAVRALEVLKNRMPSYGQGLELLQAKCKEVELKITRERRAELELVASAMALAQTAEEEMAILRRAQLLSVTDE